MPALKVNPDGTPHIHEWVRKLRGSKNPNSMYKCAHPDCFTFQASKELIGKRTVCGVCHKNDFVLTRESLRRTVPRCEDCSQTQSARRKRFNANLLVELGLAPPPSATDETSEKEGTDETSEKEGLL